MKSPLTNYRPFGQPASVVVTINAGAMENGATLTIDGVAYVAGTDFGLAGNWTGSKQTATEIAQNVADAINGKTETPLAVPFPSSAAPVKSHWAYYYKDRVVVIATVPGLSGNTMTITTSSNAFTLSGATLTGGYDGPGGGTNTTTTVATLAQAYKTVTASGVPEAVGSGLVESVLFTARKNRTTANTGDVFIGFSPTNDTQLRQLSPGESVSYTAPEGKKINLAGIYIDVATNGDGVLYETGN